MKKIGRFLRQTERAPTPTEYTYHGIVSLTDRPYQEVQKGEDGVPRKVWMFPLPCGGTVSMTFFVTATEEFGCVPTVEASRFLTRLLPW